VVFQVPDPKPTEPPAGDPPQEPIETDQEKGFWSKFDEHIGGAIDKKLDEIRDRSRSGQRTGRTTFPKMLADLVWGPDPADKK
jgi:hypothetical protein